jgi:ATP-dependent DNA helicase RecG
MELIVGGLFVNIGYESETVEFKKSIGELKEAVISVASILNKHKSGVLYFGVKNNGDIIGQQSGAETARDISHKIQEGVKPTPLISVEQLPFGDLYYFRVNFSGKETPYSAFGRYYIRTSDEDRELTPTQLRDLFFDTGDYTDWEDTLTEYTADDIDEQLLRASYKDGLEAGRFSEPFSDKVSVLSRLNLLKNGRLTNAGVMLYSSRKPLTLKLALFATDERLTLIDHAHFKGNIYECIDEGMVFLKKHMRWRAEYHGGVKRTDVPEVHPDALREILINSFAHAKYAGMLATHEIDIYPSSIEIFNPGRLPAMVKPEEFAKGREKSLLRNRTIAEVLFRTTIVEAFATGFRKVITLCREGNVKYRYANSNEGFSFEFLRKPVESEMVHKVMTVQDLGGYPLEVYNAIKANAKITIQEIADKIGQGRSTINRALDVLKQEGFIIFEGSPRDGAWVILK